MSKHVVAGNQEMSRLAQHSTVEATEASRAVI
jgi:hypothetical protein